MVGEREREKGKGSYGVFAATFFIPPPYCHGEGVLLFENLKKSSNLKIHYSKLGLKLFTFVFTREKMYVLFQLNAFEFFFSNYFCCPRSWTLLLLEGYIMAFMEMFSHPGTQTSLVLTELFLIHLAVQVQAISCTPLSPGCKFRPLVSLLDNHSGVRSTRVRTIVCKP